MEEKAKPFAIRIEGPVDAGNREETMIALRDITAELERRGSKLEIVADEWCNTLEDIKYFADNKAGHMLQRQMVSIMICIIITHFQDGYQVRKQT